MISDQDKTATLSGPNGSGQRSEEEQIQQSRETILSCRVIDRPEHMAGIIEYGDGEIGILRPRFTKREIRLLFELSGVRGVWEYHSGDAGGRPIPQKLAEDVFRRVMSREIQRLERRAVKELRRFHTQLRRSDVTLDELLPQLGGLAKKRILGRAEVNRLFLSMFPHFRDEESAGGTSD